MTQERSGAVESRESRVEGQQQTAKGGADTIDDDVFEYVAKPGATPQRQCISGFGRNALSAIIESFDDAYSNPSRGTTVDAARRQVEFRVNELVRWCRGLNRELKQLRAGLLVDSDDYGPWTPCTWIQTLGRGKLDFIAPDPDVVSIEALAIGLSREGRFARQTDGFYTVAQHSVFVTDLVEARGGSKFDMLLAMLHDTPEAWTGDIARPLKILLPQMKAIEKRLFDAVCTKLLGETVPKLPTLVKHCDEIALAVEGRDLFNGGPVDNWTASLPQGNNGERIKALPMEEALVLYMNRWAGLMAKSNQPQMDADKR